MSTAAAQTADEEWQYRICEDGYAEVTGYTGAKSALEIPQTLGGAWVVRVAEGALATVRAESIQVPASVSQIPAGALPQGAAIRAANGTGAHQLALAEGASFVNLSSYDFYDDILDLSEMAASQFSFTGNQLTLSDPYARLLEKGTRLFLPATGDYVHGLPVEAVAVERQGSAAQITVREVSFGEAVERYAVEGLQLVPDYSNAVILADGFTLINQSPKAGGFTKDAVWNVNFETPSGFSITGSLTTSIDITIDLEMEWLDLKKVNYENKEVHKMDIKVSQTKKFSNPTKMDEKLTFARIPLTSPGLVSAWLETALVIQLEGSVAVEYTIVRTENFQWCPEDNILDYTYTKSSGEPSLSAAMAIGAEVQVMLTVSVGFKKGKLSIDVARLTVAVGGQVKMERTTITPDCTDVALVAKARLTIQLGLLNADKPNLALTYTPLDLSWSIKKWHVEIVDDKIKWMEACNQACTVALCTYAKYSKEAVMVLRGEKLPSLENPTREGYTFTGWYLDSACTQALPSDFVVKESMTLYAGWAIPTPTPSPTPTPTPTPAPTLIPPTPTPTTNTAEESLQYLVWESSDTAVTITGHTGDPHSITIPTHINGLPVTAIGDYAFEDCLTLLSVEIPGTVKTIGYKAFEDCNNLSTLTMHEGIETIDSYAFNFCGMSSLDVPDSVTSWGAASFGNNDSLWYVKLPVSLESVHSVYSAFSGCDALTTVHVPEGMKNLPGCTLRNLGALTNVSLPTTLRSIGYQAFYYCTSLEYISLPSGLTSLGTEAFSHCTKLKRITIPNGVKVIPQHCFSSCNMLQSITLPEGLKEIALCGINGSQMLETLHIPDSVETLGQNAVGNNPLLYSVNVPLSLKSVGSWPNAFDGNPKLTHMTVPEGMVDLPPDLFCGMESLMSVTLPSTLRTIGYGAFESCTNLTEIDIPDGVESIGTGAFMKSGLKSITIPDGVTHLPADMVADCESLAHIYLPEGVTSIGRCAINGCTVLTTLHIPDSVRTMGANAIGNNPNLYSVNIPVSLKEVDSNVPPYYNCPQLTHMVVPEGMENLPAYIFESMKSLVGVTLPSTLKTIGSYAFRDTNLVSLTLPDGLEYIGSYAFAGNKQLTSVHIPGTVKTIAQYAFENNQSLSELIIDEGVEFIGQFAFCSDTCLTQVVLPDSITVLNDRAFGSCAALTEINIPLSLTTVEGYYGPFENSEGLTSMSIPEGMAAVPANLFSGMDHLKEVYVPASVESIGSKAFADTGLQTMYTPVRGSYGATYFTNYFPEVEIVVTHENLCVVNFNSQGGSKVSSSYVNIGEKVKKPRSPQRENYAFTGWYTDKNCTTPWDFDVNTAPSTGLTLYAGWDSNPPYVFDVTGGTATILYYTGTKSDITLPTEYDDLPVTRLAAGSIPASVTSVTIPACITQVDPGAFRFAGALYSIAVNSANTAYKSVSGVLYTTGGTLHTYPSARSNWTYTPVTGTTTIGEKAFMGVKNLSEINLPASVKVLENMAINNCEKLTDVNCKEDMITIGAGCFAGSQQLRISGPLEADVLIAYADSLGLRYNDYELTFMDGLTELGTVRVRAGALLDAPQEPTISALTFQGWSTTADTVTLWDFDTGVMPQENMTLYTVWSLDYTVTPVDGGVALSGYTGGKDPVLVPEDVNGQPVVAIEDGTFPDPSVTLQGNKGSVTQIYAEAAGMAFVPLTYTVRFNTAGGTQTVEQTRCATDLVEEPTVQRAGYELAGWYTDAALTQPWSFSSSAMPASDLTLYAAWTKLDGAEEVPFTWESTPQGLTITGYTGADSDITIPEMINGETVTAIAAYAFQGNLALKQVSIPASVTSIGAYAFADCSGLNTIVLPDGLTAVNDGLFAGCTFLRSVTLPDGLQSIGDYAFMDCRQLTSLTLGAKVNSVAVNAFDGCTTLQRLNVAEGNLYFVSQEGVLFSADGTRLIRYPQGKVDTAYTVPEGVLSIGERAMASSRIRKLNLPASLTAIGQKAMQGSMGLSSITFAEDCALSVIGANAFTGCNSLQSIALPDDLEMLGAEAFSGCMLTDVTIPAGTILSSMAIPAEEGLTITGTAGSDAERYALLHSIRFVDPARDIPVTGAQMPETLTVLCGETVQLTWQLIPANTHETAVTFASSNTAVASIDEAGQVTGWSRGRAIITLRTVDGSEAQCTVIVQEANASATSVTLNKNTVVMAAGAQLTLQASLEPRNAEPALFWSSSDDNVATVSEGCITAVGAGSCEITVTTLSGLTSSCTITIYPALAESDVILPASLTEIEPEAFRATPWTALRLPENVKSIGSLAFADCANLQAISIPAGVTSIAADAFNGCSTLIIYGQEGSLAEQFAQEHRLTFVAESFQE